MEYSKENAKILFRNKNFIDAAIVYSKIWKSNINSNKVDVWLAWEYAKTLKKLERLDEAIEVCKIVYKKDKIFKYNRDLLSWCLYEKYLKNIKNKDKVSNMDQIIKIAIFITRITEQDASLPYEKTTWKIINLYKDPFNATEVDKWLCKLNVDLLEDIHYVATVNNKNIELASSKEKWYYLKCKSLEKLKKYEECIEMCDIALINIKKFHNNRDVWINKEKAECLLKLGFKEKAMSLLLEILKRNDHWSIHEKLFQIQVELENTEDALSHAYTAALSKDPPRGKINLYFEIGKLLEMKNEFKYSLMHYYLVDKIREEEGWKKNNDLISDIERLEKCAEVNSNNLYAELREYWLCEKLKLTNRNDGTILKLIPNGKSGFIKAQECTYYFKITSFLSKPTRIIEGSEVTFRLIDSFDHKKGIETKEAVDILLIQGKEGNHVQK